MTSASQIADVMLDVRTRRVVRGDAPVDWKIAAKENIQGDIPVIDATEIYNSILARNKPYNLYEDHECIMPPWENFAIGYVNRHGNVHLMLSVEDRNDRWDTDNIADWSQVHHKLGTMAFLGGLGAGKSIPTTGPLFGWRYAIGRDGEPLDLRWVHFDERFDRSAWDMAQLVHLGALNFLNCRNVEIVEPQRPRAERRRIERTGQRIHTINVFPVGRTTRGGKGDPVGVPLTSVRGHFARYGPEFGREKLFGKYSGRFWRPMHARGSAEHGEVEHDYRLRVDEKA